MKNNFNTNENLWKGINGFKNGAPGNARDSWGNVQLFIDTWGFLPNDTTILEKLNKDQLINLCIYVMSSACKIDLMGDGIKFVQKYMDDLGISPDKLN